MTERKMDFLCVGFQKAGTTTLDTILRQHSQINLPKIKETQYFYWNQKYKKSWEILWKRYYADKDGICGAIEPEFESFPKEIREVFGKDIKLIFIMRNPVDRLFSSYRMELRRGNMAFVENSRHRKNVRQMFEQFVEAHMVHHKAGKKDYFIERGKYMKVISEFQKYFPEKNMKFIIFEEFIQKPEVWLDQIQDFLGISKEKLNCRIIENKGNRVNRNYHCACINSLLIKCDFKLWTNRYVPISLYMRYKAFMDTIMRYTTVESKNRMSLKAQKICEDFYREDKKNLEKFLRKDLSQLWYI